MGFWWSGTSKETLPRPSVYVGGDTRPSPPSDPQPDAGLNSQPSKPLIRDEQSVQESTAWLNGVDSGPKQNRPSEKLSTPEAPQPTGSSTETLYPTEISCTSAFNYASFCQSLHGQFVNVYRYGSFRSCSNHWQDFWLCMRTRQWEKEDRERAIADHYRKKAIKYKQGPSSEDVWEMRTEPVKDAFQGDLEALEREVAEWRRQNPGAKEPWE